MVAVLMGAPWIICLSMWFVLSGSLGDEPSRGPSSRSWPCPA